MTFRSIYSTYTKQQINGLLPPELLQIRQLRPPVDCRGKSGVWSGLVWSGRRKTFLHVFRTNIMKIISAISGFRL